MTRLRNTQKDREKINFGLYILHGFNLWVQTITEYSSILRISVKGKEFYKGTHKIQRWQYQN